MNIGGIKSEWFNYSTHKLQNGKELPIAELKSEYKKDFEENSSNIAKQILEQLSSKKDDLDENQLKLLKDKYAGKDMTKETYQSFLNGLVDMGILTEDEKYLAGSVKETGGYQLTPIGIPFSSATVSEARSQSSYIPMELSSLCKDMDITDLVKYRASCEKFYYIGDKSYKSNENELFEYISNIISGGFWRCL